MKSKRVLAAIISLLAAFSLIACKSSKQTTMVQGETIGNNVVYNEVPQDAQSNNVVATDAAVENNQQQSTQAVQAEATTAAETTAAAQEADDPAAWSTDRIVEEYKNAARKSNSAAKSTQSISLKSMSVNNGEYANVMDFVGGIMGKFLESNSTVKDGITGGFENLTAQDVSSAKAYKQGTDTVIEMYLHEQTSGACEDANSGSVGHAITAVGDIALVVNDLSSRGLPLELSEEETKIYYTNPSVKVVINSNGEIVSGTWFYTVEIKMDNFKAFGQNVNTASIIMDNTITV
ncbi:MAG: hypothetical protein IKV44_04885 [Clostridia bacterium]|nr:hypothetical protein [Clostridia bacterium]